MSERRTLLDPKIYKISEEDSQDEEVLQALGSSRKDRGIRNNESLGRSSQDAKELLTLRVSPTWEKRSGEQRLQSGTWVTGGAELTTSGREVKWSKIESDSDTSLSGSEETDDSRESECWTCSSTTSNPDESEDESLRSGSSCSSCCESRNFPNFSKREPIVTAKDRQASNISTFPNCFPERDGSRTREDSNYFLSENDIEFHTDTEGNTKIIEFYSSSDGESEVEHSESCLELTKILPLPLRILEPKGDDWPNETVVNPVEVECIVPALSQSQTTPKSRRDVGVSRAANRARNSTRKGPKMDQNGAKVSAPKTRKSSIKSIDKIGRSFLMPQSHSVPTPERMGDTFLIAFATRTSESSTTRENGGKIIYVWPPEESRIGSSEEKYKSLVTAIPVILTILGILKKDIGTRPARSKMVVDCTTMDVEFWSDDSGLTLLLFMSNVEDQGCRWTRSTGYQAQLAELITRVLTFKWGTVERAFVDANHNATTRVLTSLLKNYSNLESTFLPHLPRLHTKMTDEKQEELHDELCLLDAGLTVRESLRCLRTHRTYFFDSNTLQRIMKLHNKETEENEGYCLGVSVFSKGKLLVTTMGMNLSHQSYSWLLLELSSIRNGKWVAVKRLLICERLYAQDSSFLGMLIGKENIIILSVIQCPEGRPNPNHIRRWAQRISIILFRILRITRRHYSVDKKTASPPATESCAAVLESTQRTNRKYPRHLDRNSVIGNAWSNIKNKVTRKHFSDPEKGEQSVDKTYKIIFVAHIDSVLSVIKVQTEEVLPHSQSWTKVQSIIPGILDRLNACRECGHLITLPLEDKTIWIGGRSEPGGKKVLVCIIGLNILEIIEKVLDEIEESA